MKYQYSPSVESKEEKAMIQWEYLVIRLTANDMAMMNKHLGELGLQHWQAYAVVAELPNHVIYLKRENKQ